MKVTTKNSVHLLQKYCASKFKKNFFHTFLMGNISYEIFYYKNGTVCNVRVYVILYRLFYKVNLSIGFSRV